MDKEQLKDIGDRVWATFWQGAIAAAPVTQVVPSWDWLQQGAATMAVAGGAAVLSLVRGMVRARRTPTSTQ